MVSRKGHIAYDETFHNGLNIIRGQNSSGKSSIMDFLFYVLGGDLLESQWREASLLCDQVVAGVLVNGVDITIAREIDPRSQRPMRMFEGPIEEALNSAAEGWSLYSYSRGSGDSFSQVLFRYLGLPEVQYGETNTKITINQVLRLLYSDQLSSVERIFRDQRFDDATTRQTVGELLLGAYSNAYYSARLKKRELDDQIKENESQIRSLIRLHSKSGHPLTIEWVASEKLTIEREIDRLAEQIQEAENQIFQAGVTDRLTLSEQRQAHEEVLKYQRLLAFAQQQLDELEIERADSEEFITALEKRLEELHHSQDVLTEFDLLKFEFCPSCLAPISEHEVEGACHLCKSAYDHDRVRRRSLQLINEYSRQREKSTELLKKRADQILEKRTEISGYKEFWQQASERYSVVIRNPTTELRSQLSRLNRELGYKKRELEELAAKQAVAEELAELARLRADLSGQLEGTNATIEFEQRRTISQKAQAAAKIQSEVLFFLKSDLERQSTFASATEITFEFDADRIAVDGESFFSASSMVYLRNSFLAGLLFAAANDRTFSHPRFLIMDTVEDKGMEPDRSRNFQRLLSQKSDEAISEHQIIIATSMIAHELDIPSITVGDFYTHDNRTLKIN